MEVAIEEVVQELIGKDYSEHCEKFAFVVSKISEDLTRVYRIKNFFELDVGTVCEILSNEDLQISSEVDTFKVAVKWLAHAIEERSPLLNRVLRCVRYTCMTETEIWRCHQISLAEKRIRVDYCPVIANIIEEECQITLNTTMAAPRRCFHDKQKMLRKKIADVLDKRYHIVQEFVESERDYIESLKTLKDKYMAQLKVHRVMEENGVNGIFHMVPEILQHHLKFFERLEIEWQMWESSSTIGNLIVDTFSKQTVQDTYLSFLEYFQVSSEKLEEGLRNKTTREFLDRCQRISGSKLTLKDLFVKPIQRIQRYELLIQRLVQNTRCEHQDFELLKKAERVMHEFASTLGTVKERPQHDEEEPRKKKGGVRNMIAGILKSLGGCFRKCVRH